MPAIAPVLSSDRDVAVPSFPDVPDPLSLPDPFNPLSLPMLPPASLEPAPFPLDVLGKRDVTFELGDGGELELGDGDEFELGDKCELGSDGGGELELGDDDGFELGGGGGFGEFGELGGLGGFELGNEGGYPLNVEMLT